MGDTKENLTLARVMVAEEFDELAYSTLEQSAGKSESLKKLLSDVNALQQKIDRSKFSRLETRQLADDELTEISRRYSRELKNEVLHKKLAIHESRQMYESERNSSGTEDLARLTRLQLKYNAMSRDELTKQADAFVSGSEDLNPDEFDLLSGKLQQNNDDKYDLVRTTGKSRNTDRPWLNFEKNKVIQKEIDNLESYGGPALGEFRVLNDQGKSAAFSMKGLINMNKAVKRNFDE